MGDSGPAAQGAKGGTGPAGPAGLAGRAGVTGPQGPPNERESLLMATAEPKESRLSMTERDPRRVVNAAAANGLIVAACLRLATAIEQKPQPPGTPEAVTRAAEQSVLGRRRRQ